MNGASARVDGAISGQANSTVNVNDGFTTEGSIALGTLAVASDGVLTLNNDITALGAFTNTGEVKIASGITRNLTSDDTQAAGGLRAIGAGSTTSYSRLIASGTVDFTTGNTLDVDIADVSAFAIGDLLCGVVQGATINGSDYTVTDQCALLTFTGVGNGNQVDLVIAQESIAEIVGAIYDALADADRTKAVFEGGGSALVAEGLEPTALGLVGGLKLDLLPESGVVVSGYDIEVRDDRIRHGGKLRLSLTF